MPTRRFRKRGGAEPPAEGTGILDQATGFASDAAGKATGFMSDAAGQATGLVSRTAQDAKEGTKGVVDNATDFLSSLNPFAKKEPEPQAGGKRRKTKRRRTKRRTRR